MTMACRKFFLPTLAVFLLGLFALIFSKTYNVYRSFVQQTNLDYQALATLWQAAQTLPIKSDHGHTNFLLLGTDTLEYRVQDYPITDTIILGSFEASRGAVRLLPIPRDIFLPELNYKVNMIYPVAYRESSSSALTVTTSKIEEIFALPIHYSAVINLADVKDFIDLLGGVDVVIDRSFTDQKFPRENVDITTITDPALLYETISFASGEAHLDGATALQFIRSRHGDNGEGNDYARSARQEKIITALSHQVLARLLNQLKSLNFTFLGQLYDFYQDRYQQQIPFVELLALGRNYLTAGQPLAITSQNLDINPGTFSANLQETAASAKNGNQWSLTITNRAGLLQEIKNKLNLL